MKILELLKINLSPTVESNPKGIFARFSRRKYIKITMIRKIKRFFKLKYPPSIVDIIIFEIWKSFNWRPFLCWSKTHFESIEKAKFSPIQGS